MKTGQEFIKSFFSIASSITPSFLLLRPSKKIILPAYNTVSDTYLPHINNLYKPKSIKQFIEDLDFLLKHAEPIDLTRLITITNQNEKVNKNYFHISFDDGLRECHDTIVPILKNKGIPATFFINPSFVDNKDLMHRYKASLIIEDIKGNEEKKRKLSNFIKRKLGIRRDPSSFLLTLKYSHRRVMDEIALLTETSFTSYLNNNRPYLTQKQLKSIAKEGFSIGAHSMDHPEYFMISEEEQLRQTIDSLNYINSEYNEPYKTFAFPFTDKKISKKFFETIFNPNPPLLDLTFGSAGLKKDSFKKHLQRIPMEKNFSGTQIIKGEYLYYYSKTLFNKNFIYRK